MSLFSFYRGASWNSFLMKIDKQQMLHIELELNPVHSLMIINK